VSTSPRLDRTVELACVDLRGGGKEESLGDPPVQTAGEGGGARGEGEGSSEGRGSRLGHWRGRRRHGARDGM
jgi:hypothetical protein